jgi:3-oxoacyl-[acyl-carrier protein] reductase
MMKRRWGRIVNIASVVGLTATRARRTTPPARPASSASRRASAKELASRNVLANVVAPGFIETDMTAAMPAEARAAMAGAIPLERFGRPQDVAGRSRSSRPSHAAYITGQVLVVDGGMVM